MGSQEAISFFVKHQPLPDQLEGPLLDQFLGALTQLGRNPDPQCIPWLLGSWGDWDEMMLHESIQAVLRQFSGEQVVPFLIEGLVCKNSTVVRWCADTARYFPDRRLVVFLAPMLTNPDPITRMTSAAALEAIGGEEVRLLAKVAAITERDSDVLYILKSMIEVGEVN